MKRRNRLLVAAALAFAGGSAVAGPIADLFRDGVFGLPWGADRATIEAKFPGGKWKREAGRDNYRVADGRTVLGVARDAKQEIAFCLSADGKLVLVSVEFPTSTKSYAELLRGADETFGPRDPAQSNFTYQGILPITVITVRWPDDDGLRVAISNMIGPKSLQALGIEHVGPLDKPSKAALGFK